MRQHILKWTILTPAVLPGILPVSCARPILRELTPFLINGSNRFAVELISAAAPFVLP